MRSFNSTTAGGDGDHLPRSGSLVGAIANYTQAGLYLVPIPPANGQPVKGPQGPDATGWNRPRCTDNPNGYSNDPDDLIRRTGQPGSNIGLALEPSRVAAIDLDDLEVSREALALADIDLDALMNDPQAVRILSRKGRGKLLYTTWKVIGYPEDIF